MAMVIVQRAFVSKIDGKTYRGIVGEMIELPKGADWLKAGFVVRPAKKKATKKTK